MVSTLGSDCVGAPPPHTQDAHVRSTTDTAIHGQPKTVFKGNQRNYTKECVIIIDKVTGEITLERLHHNIQVKKTRTEINKPAGAANNGAAAAGSNGSAAGSNGGAAVAAGQAAAAGGSAGRIPLENSTQRTVSKTRVSTGQRKNIGSIVQRNSPMQGSPSYPHQKSPQDAPA